MTRLSARERYARMPESAWWKRTYQGKSLGEPMPQVECDEVPTGYWRRLRERLRRAPTAYDDTSIADPEPLV